jgi:hypothetical protein
MGICNIIFDRAIFGIVLDRDRSNIIVDEDTFYNRNLSDNEDTFDIIIVHGYR